MLGPEGCVGWIYAAQEEGTPLVKIGCTSESRRAVARRVQKLATFFRVRLTPVAAVPVFDRMYRIERYVHACLAAEHIEREWFYVHMSQVLLEQLVSVAAIRVAADIAAQKEDHRTRETFSAERRQLAQKQVLFRKAARAEKVRQMYRLGHIARQYGLHVYDDATLHTIFGSIQGQKDTCES